MLLRALLIGLAALTLVACKNDKDKDKGASEAAQVTEPAPGPAPDPVAPAPAADPALAEPVPPPAPELVAQAKAMCCCEQGPALVDSKTCTRDWRSRCQEMTACEQRNTTALAGCQGGSASDCAAIDEHWAVLDEDRYRTYRTAARAAYAAGCQGNDAYACVSLGDFYGADPSHGKPPPGRDPTRAIDYWKKACDAKNDLGCERLWDAYRDGYGVKADAKRAAEYQELACQHGSDRACDPPTDH
jgi:hypothetical protein